MPHKNLHTGYPSLSQINQNFGARKVSFHHFSFSLKLTKGLCSGLVHASEFGSQGHGLSLAGGHIPSEPK